MIRNGKENGIVHIGTNDILEFLKKDFILVFKNSILLAILYLCCIPVIRGIENLNSLQSAQCLEQSVSVIGIILMVPLTKWEHDAGIKDLIVSKTWSYMRTVIIRILFSVCLIVMMTMGFVVIMKINNCSLKFWYYILGSSLVSIFMGNLGLLFSQISGNVIGGYLAALGYHSLSKLNILSEGEMSYLFPLSYGETGNAAIVILLAVNVALFLMFFRITRNRKTL